MEEVGVVERQSSVETTPGQSEIVLRCLQAYQRVITSHEQQDIQIEATI